MGKHFVLAGKMYRNWSAYRICDVAGFSDNCIKKRLCSPGLRNAGLCFFWIYLYVDQYVSDPVNQQCGDRDAE